MESDFVTGALQGISCLVLPHSQGENSHNRGPDLVEQLPCVCETLDSICRTVVGRDRRRSSRGSLQGLCNEISVIARVSSKEESLDGECLDGSSP